MSYRLIDANAIAALWPEVNDMPCIYADLSSGLDGGHYDMRESDELQRENDKLRELVHKQDALTKAVHVYWAGGERSLDDFNVMMHANAQVLALMRELRIEVG